MTGTEKIDKIIETIKAGYTVYFTTYTNRSYSVDAKVLRRFEKAGHELFKTNSKDNLMMLNGKSYVCMDGCKITYS